MRASLASPGSHGIAYLHVYVDCIVLPSGRWITNGVISGKMSVTGVPGSPKWPVAPASAISMLTAISTVDVLNRVSDWGDCSSFCC